MKIKLRATTADAIFVKFAPNTGRIVMEIVKEYDTKAIQPCDKNSTVSTSILGNLDNKEWESSSQIGS